MSVAESACARGTPVGWVAFLRMVPAPRGAVDGNAVAKGVYMIYDEMMMMALRFPIAWSQCRESQCACVHRTDGAAVGRASILLCPWRQTAGGEFGTGICDPHGRSPRDSLRPQ